MRKELGINTYQDLINLFPNRYIDRTRFYRTSELQSSNSEVQLIGKITSFKEIVQKRGKRLVATFKDDTGFIELVWFRGHKWIHEQLKTHTDYVVFGKVNLFNGVFSMPHPDIELKSTFDKGLSKAIQPIYPSTEKLSNRGVSNRVICKVMEQLFLQLNGRFEESLSLEILQHQKLISKSEALLNIHFPNL